MSTLGIGDLAQSFQLRRDNARLQETFRTLADELSSGRRSDLGRTVAGDFGPLPGIERGLKTVAAYETSATEAGLMADVAQSALGFVRDRAQTIAPTLLLSEEDYQPTMVDAAGANAARGFEDAVNALNARVGDRSVFAGTATDSPALADPETMLTELETVIAGETAAAGVEAAVTAWFAPGGDFETTGYLGGAAPLSGIPISEGARVALDVTAADPGVRDVLAGLALGALLDRGLFAGILEERAGLARASGDRLLSADYAITGTRARVGVAEERIETAKSRNAAEAQSLELARASILEVDLFETASRMREVEVQLETLYTVTARMSRLNLTAFL